ncbi:hypothetical protein [Chryseobacterium sp. ISL-6]|uniref:hypothetical protein n=1 Tax=Chryseobacterium sp. ISL-6 TaxID=2819143 RepID=UPI001BEC4180|nr:hypothetical protein [Chryseobacterium sp. ISL-6]MBT2623725.1 hypothetical protein [Chryseobacterium sp. ISL-6]
MKKIRLIFLIILSPTVSFSQSSFYVNQTKDKNSLTVKGNASIGSSYIDIVAPLNGTIIEGKLGVGTSNPLEKLHVNGEIRVDATKISSINGSSVNWGNLRTAAASGWQMPLGWRSDNTLAVLPGRLQTEVSLYASKEGTLLTVPSVSWRNGTNTNDRYALKIEGFFDNNCSAPISGLLTLYITSRQMAVTLNNKEVGTITTPSPGIYVWTSPGSACGGNRNFTYDSNTRVLSYGGTGGSTILNGTATLYGTI